MPMKGNGPTVYADRTLPDGDAWLDILRSVRAAGAVFEDTEFPASDASVWRDPSQKTASRPAEVDLAPQATKYECTSSAPPRSVQAAPRKIVRRGRSRTMTRSLA